MIRNPESPMRFYIEGILSFVKGCDNLAFVEQSALGEDIWALLQRNENPLAYTKLSCFLPWVADQYGLSHGGDTNNPSCTVANGERNATQACRTKTLGERKCIFPFYFEGKLYKECGLLEPSNFLYPVFRCPQFNSNKKTEDGINDYSNFNPNKEYCLVCPKEGCSTFDALELDPSSLNCGRQPFSTCKNDCPGGKYVPG